jgi:uncharacterized surface protein with fasciclin (FAS1) repeats
MTTQTHPGTATAQDDIVATATKNGSFTTLVAALKAADLVTTLQGKGPFTVFAPNDAAFAKVPKATLDELLLPANKAKLASLLTYHVVAGKVSSKDLAGKTMKSKSVEGHELTIDGTNGVMVNGAKVIGADIDTANGIIHVVDSVIMLPAK